MEMPAHFALAAVRMHRWKPGCSHYSLNDKLHRDEVDFLRSNEAETAPSSEDMLLCGRILVASLRNIHSTPTVRRTGGDVDIAFDPSSDEDEDEEEEIFNRDIDAIEFKDWTHSSTTTATTMTPTRQEDGIFFHLPKDHPRFLTMQGVGVPDPRFKRTYYVQQEVCFLVLLSNVPYQAYLKEKLQGLAMEVFANCADDGAISDFVAVEEFFKSLTRSTNFTELPYRELYVGLPIVNLVRWLGKDILAVLRVILLEGRVMCYSTNPAVASSGTLALLALLPGVLSHTTDFTSRTIQAVVYRLRRYGMPLSLIDEDFMLQPCFTKDQMDAVYSTAGFLVGASDPLLSKHPTAQLDLIVDLDTRHLVTYPTMKAEYAFAFGPSTAAFGDSLALRFGRNMEPPSPSPERSESRTGSRTSLRTLSGQLSRVRLTRRRSIRTGPVTEPVATDVEWVLAQFQSYFEHFLEEGYKGIFSADGETDTSTSTYDPYNPSIVTRIEDLAVPVFSDHSKFYAEYGRAWSHAWQKTHNFENWISAHRLERRRSTIVPPTASPPQEGRAAYTYANGDEYEGEFKRGKRHGFGVYIEHATKNQYEGDWREDKRHGNGILCAKHNGYIYDGEWRDDVRCGHGHCILKNVENYVGEWLDNRFHGLGVHSNADGDTYDGEWRCGVKHGTGKLAIVHGKPEEEFGGLKQYVGEWRAGRFHGTGTVQYVDGSQYSGGFLDGKRHGNGLLVLANGDRYDGQWWKGFRHGEGSFLSMKSGITREGAWRKDVEVDGEWFLKYPNGDKYTGACKRGRPWGQGICKYANGSSYSGEWVDGLREGVGVLINADGSMLEGEWRNSVFTKAMRAPSRFVDIQLSTSPHRSSQNDPVTAASLVLPQQGSHLFVYPNGDRYEGDFKGGQRYGFGVLTERVTGNVYEGEWCRDHRHGNGVLTSGMKDFIYDGKWENDVRAGYGHCVIRGCETYTGQWRANQFNGQGKYIDADGNVYEGEFVEGRKHGMGKQVFTAQKAEYSGEWVQGRRHGIGDAKFADGSSYSGGWKDDRIEGEGTLTHANEDRYTGQFCNGMRDGAGVLFSPSTGTTKEGMWAADEAIDGEWTILFPDGSKFTGACVRGRPHGRGVCKYASGDLYDGQWINGNRQGHGIGFFANGDSFIGDWENNHVALNGKGTLTLADGTVHVYAQ